MTQLQTYAALPGAQTGHCKALIYCRVSSTKQKTEGSGLDSQEARCRKYAADKGYSVTAVFPDDASGGGDYMKRPGMVALLAFLDAQPNERFVVIFDDIKRFARDTVFHLQLRQVLKSHGAILECLNFKFEDTPEGDFIETIMAAQGELERKQNQRQVIQKMRARVEQGYWLFPPPAGYRYGKCPDGGKILMPKTPNAPIIREALEGYASGRFDSAADVTRFLISHPSILEERKSAHRAKFAADLLRQPLYAGYMNIEKWNMKMRPCKHEPLISLETWHKIQDRIDGRSKTPARPTVHEDFPLRHFVSCSSCGVPMTSAWSKGRSKNYGYYFCRQKGCELHGKNIRKERVEEDFAEVARSLTPRPQLFAATITMFRKIWNARLQSLSQQHETGLKNVAAIDGKITKLVDRIVNSANDRVIAAYEKEIDALEKRKRILENNKTKVSESTRPFETAFRAALEFMAMPWKLWESGEFAKQRLLLKLALPEPLPYCPKTGFLNRDFSLPFKVLGSDSVRKNGLVEPRST